MFEFRQKRSDCLWEIDYIIFEIYTKFTCWVIHFYLHIPLFQAKLHETPITSHLYN